MPRLRVSCLAGALLGARARLPFCCRASADWEDIPLVALLAVLALVATASRSMAHGQRLSGSIIALVLAMAVLGPAPAVAIAVLTIVVDERSHRVEDRTGAAALRTSRPTRRSHSSARSSCAGARFRVAPPMTRSGSGFRGVSSRLRDHEILAQLPADRGRAQGACRAVGQGSGSDDPSPAGAVGGAAAATLVLAFAVVYAMSGFGALAVLVVALLAFQILTREPSALPARGRGACRSLDRVGVSSGSASSRHWFRHSRSATR
jgi:hypothetical protein